MKKLLILATMFLSSAVQAETFFCETSGWARVSQNGQGTGKSDDIYIVDSDKGWKATGISEYEGVCDFLKLGEREVLECKNTEGPSELDNMIRYEFTIWLGSTNEFVKLDRFAGSVTAFSGRCTKI